MYVRIPFSSIILLCSTLCGPMDCSMPGFPIHHQLSELAQTHRVDEAIQPSYPLSSPSPPAFSFSQKDPSRSFPISQFASGGQSIGASASASVLPKNIQYWFHLGLADLISLKSKGLSRVFSNITVQNHQFFSAQLSFFFSFFWISKFLNINLF